MNQRLTQPYSMRSDPTPNMITMKCKWLQLWYLLVQSLNRSHGGLDMKRPYVLPMLLQQRDQEIHSQMNILHKIFLRHSDVAYSNGKAENFLHLKLDGGLQVQDLLLQVVAVSDQGGEFTGFVQARTQKSGNLLDQSVGCQEGVVLLCQLLRLLLVFVQFLKVVSRHTLDTKRPGLITMLLISKQTHLELVARNMLKLNGSGETLVLLGVVVLKTDLEVHGFGELPFLVLCMLQDSANTLIELFLWDLGHC